MSAAGTWKNEYGSIMTLEEAGASLTGIYQSSTGSVGIYEVHGVQVGNAATAALGQPVALSISWHAIDDACHDPSWHWNSGLCGQISLQDDQEVLVLAHNMVASSDFFGLVKAGSYIDKLTYRRAPLQEPERSLRHKNEVPGNPLAGRWISAEGTALELKVYAAADNDLGYVSGRLVRPTGTLPVEGFTDLHSASVGIAMQSLALTAAGASEVLGLSGTLDGSTGSLTLLEMTSESTAPGNSYSQTRMATLLFKRDDTQR
jgi:hypothetical protein